MKLRRLAATFGVAAALATSACGLPDSGQRRGDDLMVTTAPALWGPSGMCYYIYSPLECTLYGPTAGLQTGRMPDYWLARYSNFYLHDPSYRDRVPATYRDDWQRDAGSWERRNSGLIKREKAFGSWVDTKTKKTVSGERPAQIDTAGKPVTKTGGKSKTVDLDTNKTTTKKDKSNWGFGSSGKTTTNKSSWGFGSSGKSSSSSGGFSGSRKP